MAISKDSDDTVDHGPAGTPDLAAWRAEAGEAARLDAAATRDWYVDKRSPRSLITGGAIPLTHIEAARVSHCGSDGTREITATQGAADIAFIAAARTGWPRDAARVAVLCDRVAALEAHVATLDALKAIGDRQEALADRFAARCEVLEAALLDAAAFIEPPPNAYLSPSVLFAARDKAAELRALAAGTAAAAGEEPAR